MKPNELIEHWKKKNLIPELNASKQMQQACLEERYSDYSNLINNLEDDLQMDLDEGEEGYKTYKESHNAIKKYTLKILNRYCKELKKRIKELLKEELKKRIKELLKEK